MAPVEENSMVQTQKPSGLCSAALLRRTRQFLQLMKVIWLYELPIPSAAEAPVENADQAVPLKRCLHEA